MLKTVFMKKLVHLFIKYFLFFLLSFNLLSQTMSKEECKILMDEGIVALDSKDYSLAIKKLSRAETVAKQEDWPEYLWYIKNNLGNTYAKLTDKGKALNELYKALEIINNYPELEKHKVTVLNNLGSFFIKQEKYEDALFYLNEAFQLMQKSENITQDNNDKYAFKVIGNNLASIYNKKGIYTKAKEVLLSIKDIQTDPVAMQAWEITFTENMFFSGQTEKALEKAKILYAETMEIKNETCHICVLDLMAEIYAEMKIYDKAIFYTNKSLQYSSDWTEKIKRYKNIEEYYKEKNDILMQLNYKDSIILGKDSLMILNNQELLLNSKVQLDLQKFENELLINRKNQKNQQTIFIILTTALILILIILYLWQKNRLKAQREKANLNQEKLKNNIAEKNRKLATKTLYLTERNKIIKEITSKLEETNSRNSDTKLKEFIRVLKEEINTTEKWKEYAMYFEEINPHFFKHLKQTHPQLNSADLRFLSYIYMNLNLQEIADIMSITIDASRKRKQRIAKKMNIPTAEVFNYLINIQKKAVHHL